MSTTPDKIAGHRPLLQVQAEVINEIKMIEAQALAKLRGLQHQVGIDQRWLAIGRTDIEKGFMSVIRAVARPEEIQL